MLTLDLDQATNLECNELQQKQLMMATRPVIDDNDRKEHQKVLSHVENRYQQLLNEHPNHPAVLHGLGVNCMNTERSAMAIMLLERLVSLPDIPKAAAWQNLAGAYKMEHRDDDAERAYRECLKCIEGGDETSPAVDALTGIGSLYVNRGEPEKVIFWCDKALELDPQHRFGLWNKGLGLLESGQWEEGFKIYDEAGFMEGGAKPKERKERTYARALRKWNGEKGVTVVCYGEQGIGDEIMFFSMLPDLMRDCKVIVECDERIIDLVKNSFPGLEAVYPTSDAKAASDWLFDHPDCQYWVPCGSLGKWYRHKAEDFPRTPYMTAEPYLVKRWGEALAPYRNLRVALSWRGGMKKTRADKRSMALADLEPILKIPGVDFFSLQYHQDAIDEVVQAGNAFNVPIHHWQDVIDHYSRTAGFLTHMDLVLTVHTSLVHLAGALGIPTLCLTPVMCAWRYGHKGRNPFYGSVEMLRQKEDGKWKDVIERARERITGLAIRKARSTSKTKEPTTEEVAALVGVENPQEFSKLVAKLEKAHAGGALEMPTPDEMKALGQFFERAGEKMKEEAA